MKGLAASAGSNPATAGATAGLAGALAMSVATNTETGDGRRGSTMEVERDGHGRRRLQTAEVDLALPL